MELIYIILLIINILLYAACCFLILRRKTFTSISIRSPILLILNIMGNFFMSIIIIVTKSLENDEKKICSFFYYITNFLIIIPFCLRFRRIAKCCEIKFDERFELQELFTQKYKYEEKYSIKLMLIIFGILTAILIILNASITRSEAITAKFLYFGEESILDTANSIIWLIINCIEHMAILSYAYYICINQLKQKLRLEIISCFIIWFIYSNLICVLELISINLDNDVYIYISLAVCYLFLIINGVLPILITFSYHYSTSYSFNPKLMNNLYLFLSNEICFNEFKIYLFQKKQNLIALLRLYVEIMNYKLGKILKINNEERLFEAMNIRNEYFGENNIARLPQNVLDKVRGESLGIENLDNNNNKDNNEVFDEALKYCFSELGKYFNEFKKTERFKELYNEFFLTTYIQCKMCNVGLINKF